MSDRAKILEYCREQIDLLARQQKQCEHNDKALQEKLQEKHFNVASRADMLTNMALQQQLMIEVNTIALSRMFKIMEIGFMNAEVNKT